MPFRIALDPKEKELGRAQRTERRLEAELVRLREAAETANVAEPDYTAAHADWLAWLEAQQAFGLLATPSLILRLLSVISSAPPR